mgnify:CR=1 FL=1
MKEYRIAVLEGDGIGPEIVSEAVKVLDRTAQSFGFAVSYERSLLGGAAIDAKKTPLPQKTVECCKTADSVLLGAVGGPKWDALPGNQRPEAGLLGIRKALGLYANLRPAVIFGPLKDASPLKSEVVGEALDIMVVRELTGGIYFGKRGTLEENGVKAAFDTEKYSVTEVERIAHTAFDLARKRNRRLCSVDKANVLDSKKALQLTKAPKSILIIGAGAIGMEFGTVFRSYGAEVTIVEMLPRVLPNEDAEVSALVEKELKKKGFAVYAGTKLVSVQNDGKMIRAELEKDGKTFTLESEYILAATGVRPNTEGLGLKNAGIATDKRGYIPVDDRMRTNVDGVYAIGDVTGKLALAHAASAQGLCAVNDLCGKETQALNYANMPKCTYTAPEVASAGLTEEKAKEAGYDAASALFPLSANGKAISYGDDTGFVKLVYDKKYGQLLGAHMVGVHVTEMVWGIVGYLGLEMTVEEMAKVVHPHPTVSEAIMEAAHIADGHPIHI